MHKVLKGYITVEASFIMPMVLLIYLLVIKSSLYLYERCITSQNNYLSIYREERFVQMGEGYGEAIYDQMKGNSPMKGIRNIRRQADGS